MYVVIRKYFNRVVKKNHTNLKKMELELLKIEFEYLYSFYTSNSIIRN